MRLFSDVKPLISYISEMRLCSRILTVSIHSSPGIKIVD